MKDFFDIGTKSTSLPNWQQPVCIGQRTELDTKFSPPLPQSRATAFPVDSNDLKASPQKPVTRVINKLLNQID